MSKPVTFTSLASLLSWDEDRSVTTLPRLTPATVKMSLPALSATVTSSYQMVYLPSESTSSSDPTNPHAANALFIYTEIIEGTNFDGKSGSFMTQGKGTFDASKFVVEGKSEIVVGSVTGELTDVLKNGGEGRFGSSKEDPTKVEYVFTAAA